LSGASIRRVVRYVVMVVCVSAPMLAVPAVASAKRLGSRVLREGMSGADVRALQADLTKAGFKTPAAGVFGSQTETNVKRFERKYGLKANGIVDAAVVAKLVSVIAPTSQTTGGAGVRTTPATSSARTKTTSTKSSAKSDTNGTKTKSSSGPSGGSGTTGSTGSTGSSGSIPDVPHNGQSVHLGNRVLREGDQGHDVRVLQDYLSLIGYPTEISGYFGSVTQRNFEAFQDAQGDSSNGVVSYSQAYSLRVAVAQMEGARVERAHIARNGLVVAPADAPPVLREIINAANKIAHKPYIYGGGHQSWISAGYDCSGSTSYALHAAGLVSVPEDSGEFESYGSGGRGRWITMWANGGHVYMQIAGLWFDTAAQSSSNGNDRWSNERISPSSGFIERHPDGL
jgi:peptidoglycan hydrolase-like protein with peptidoglycan-binding domain